MDHYTDALAEVIKAKREGHALPAAAEVEAPAGQVVDLMSALEATVQKARASRGKDGDADVHELPAKKKTTAKKTAKKATVKKTTARKSAAQKSAAKPKRSA
ncbi:hypothetical protein O1Q96_22255 [Streptomyces sp. Qhu-G9]|uniref:hypothetical protein n=1 Tax=Streptomyces sp. Qhu-G9 TaxID=3452799 RepID=UPI0022AC3926|nr:hypothetical protein [Streptomyces aurantiacus]WAU82243.1 hypothetical protein O1Q96_22255 [Streptomyces aurantiacus]